MRAKRTFAAAALVALLAAAALTPAWGAEVTRESYVAAVEPICRRNAEANERIFAGVRRQVVNGHLKAAAVKFEAAAKALRATVARLKAVPRPPADRQVLKLWFADIDVEVGLFKATAQQLRAGDRSEAERTSAKPINAAVTAKNQVAAFEFHYCRSRPSEFT
jgi:hypothetical protein